MAKYNADQEIMNIYENLQIVWSQFFTDMLLFIYIRSPGIYWFIGIRIFCQEIPTNTYSVTFDYWKYSVSYLMSNNKGNFKLFTPTYMQHSFDCTCLGHLGWHNTDGSFIFCCSAQGCQGKYSHMNVVCQCCLLVLLTSFANALAKFSTIMPILLWCNITLFTCLVHLLWHDTEGSFIFLLHRPRWPR